MKKEYKSPATVIVNLDAEPMMCLASTETDGVNVGNKPVGGNTPDLSNAYRNDWGDIWK